SCGRRVHEVGRGQKRVCKDSPERGVRGSPHRQYREDTEESPSGKPISAEVKGARLMNRLPRCKPMACLAIVISGVAMAAEPADLPTVDGPETEGLLKGITGLLA